MVNTRIYCKSGLHEWNEENTETKQNGRRTCKICRRLRDKNRKKKLNTTKEGKDAKKNVTLRLMYGITLEEYNFLLRVQNNKCAICGRNQEEFVRNFSVDHCHSTNKVRGLLCMNCNIGIGNLQDNIEILKKAIKYLKKW